MLCVQEGTTTTLPGKKVESRNYKTHILEFNVYNVQLNLPAPQQRTITNFIKVTNLRFKQYVIFRRSDEAQLTMLFFYKKIEMTVSTVMYFGIFLGVL